MTLTREDIERFLRQAWQGSTMLSSFEATDLCELALLALDTPSAAEIEARAYERAAKVCDDQKLVFLSDEYALFQPLTSVSERLACDSCAAAIRALSPTTTKYVELPEGHVVVSVEHNKAQLKTAYDEGYNVGHDEGFEYDLKAAEGG